MATIVHVTTQEPYLEMHWVIITGCYLSNNTVPYLGMATMVTRLTMVTLGLIRMVSMVTHI